MMCRFIAYRGPPVDLRELLYEPEHSLIHQSVHAHERKEPLNGDGWGVGWYDPDRYPLPASYRTLHPAWSDDNMRHVAPLIETSAFLAHVRAASPGLPVHRLNCHPFVGGLHEHDDPDDLGAVERGRRKLLFMHNGGVGAFRKIKQRLVADLDEGIYHGIRGSTDSEHAFAVLQQVLGDAAADPSCADLRRALVETLAYLDELKADVGRPDASTEANFCVTDGEQIAVTRYASPDEDRAASLYVGTADRFVVDDAEVVAEGPEGDRAALVASEALWEDDRVWQKVPEDHVVSVDADGAVTVEPIDLPA